MFNLNEIKELINLIDQSSLHELEIQNETYKLSIRKPNKTESVIVASSHAHQSYLPAAAVQTPAPAPQLAEPAVEKPAVQQDEPKDTSLHKIVSPMVGTVYQSASPDAPPFVKAGDKVQEKTVVCIIEAMKLMNEIEAEIKGEIVEVLVENGQLVEYGQPLFLVKV